MALRYTGDIVNLKSSCEGFAREFDRIQILFRELQTEFLRGVEEKRQNVDILVRASKLLKQKEIERMKNKVKEVSDYNLQDLLPKLKEQHEQSNKQLAER